MTELVTYFDRNYLPQGLALYRSLERTSQPFRLWILCLDDTSERILRALDLTHAELITVEEIVAARPALAAARSDRSQLEFYYALTPWLVDLIRERTGGPVAYVDADMFFLAPFEAVVAEAPDASVMLVAHRSGDEASEREHGEFNVCLVWFGVGAQADDALAWWGAAVLESTRFGAGVWGDQKYLDEFPRRFAGVHVIRNVGVGLAPWHLSRFPLESGRRLVDGSPVVAFHFARLLMLSERVFVPVRRDWWVDRRALLDLYRPYMRELRVAYRAARAADSSYRLGYMRHNLRGAILSVLAGRAFYDRGKRLVRIGLYVPINRRELDQRRSLRRLVRS